MVNILERVGALMTDEPNPERRNEEELSKQFLHTDHQSRSCIVSYCFDRSVFETTNPLFLTPLLVVHTVIL